AALSSYVSPAIRARGREYHRAGAVTLDAAGPDAVSATVRGSDLYDVDLALAGRTVTAWCTCPYVDQYGSACKHIWAVLLAAEPRGFAAAVANGRLRLALEGDEGEDDEPGYHPPARPPRPPVWTRPAPRRETWKDQLAAVRREVEPAGR